MSRVSWKRWLSWDDLGLAGELTAILRRLGSYATLWKRLRKWQKYASYGYSIMPGFSPESRLGYFRFRLLRDATLFKPQVTKSPLGDGQEYAGTLVSNANQIEIQESS